MFFKQKTDIVILYHCNCALGSKQPDVELDRVALYCLSVYYTMAQKNTYFAYQDITHYSTPWLDWFDAISYDIGVPTSDRYIYQIVDSNPDASTNLIM